MKTITTLARGTTILIVRTAVGLVTRGSPTVRTASSDEWQVIVDDFDASTMDHDRLLRVLADAERDPIDAVFRHFDAASGEAFALVGPPGAIVGSGPRLPTNGRISVWVEPSEGIVALGLDHSDETDRSGWLSLPAGTAVCWGPRGPEVFCDVRRGASALWIADDRSGRWVPVAA